MLQVEMQRYETGEPLDAFSLRPLTET